MGLSWMMFPASYKIKTIVQAGRGKLHPHPVGQLVERHQIRRVFILYGHSKPYILHPHSDQLLKRRIAFVKSIRQSPDLIVGILQPLNGDADTYVRKFPAQIKDSVRKKSVCDITIRSLFL